jgi:predicted permease
MQLLRRLVYWLRHRSQHAALGEELAFHRKQLEEESLARGMSPAGARDAARRAMGDETYMREESRQVWIRPWLSSLVQDLALSLRGIRRAPGFSIAVILTLGLGVGATTAVFSLINAVVLRPLPYPHPDRLYTLFERDSLGTGIRVPSYPTFQDWQQQTDAFDGMVFVRGTGLTLRHGDRTGLVLTAFVSEEFFRTLGAPMIRGRALVAGDFQPGQASVAVLSHGLWHQYFGGDPEVVGKTVTIGDVPVAIVGVLPAAFAYPDWGGAGTDLWMPIAGMPAKDLADLHQRGVHVDSRVIARLKPGVLVANAEKQLNTIARRLAETDPDANARWTRVVLTPLAEFMIGRANRRLYVLAGAVGFVLLICCVNVANLYLANGAARRHEFAVRAALGAGRGRVLRQLLTETTMLTSLGGVLAVLLATVIVQSVRVSGSTQLPRLNGPIVDLRVLAFTAAITIASALLFAAIAARRVAAPRLGESLGERAGTPLARARRGRLPTWLLATQLGFTAVLLIGASLLAQTFWRLSQVDPGFDPERLVTSRIAPPSPRYDEPMAARILYERLAGAVAAVPGVEDVALINHPPAGDGGLPSRAAIGRSPSGGEEEIRVLFETVSAEYLSTMRIPIRAGRDLIPADMSGPPGPIIINEALARRWGGRSPLGERLDVLKAARARPDFGEPIIGTVVGIAGDVKHFGLDSDPPPTVYVPYTHNIWAAMTLVARTTGDPDRLLTTLDRTIRQVDATIPLEGPGLGAETMARRLERSYAPRRFNATLMAGFALVALLLSAVGVYGVTSYTVAMQAREIGIRLSLGATPAGVRRAVVGRVARIATVGLLAGIVASLGLTRLIRGLLFEVQPTDPRAYAVAGLALLVIAAIAALLPATRASRVDPTTVLRA